MDAVVRMTATPPNALAVAGGIACDAWYALARHAAALGAPRMPGAPANMTGASTTAGDPARATAPAVVLIPGIYEPAEFMSPLRRQLEARGHRVIVLPELGYNRRTIPDSAAAVANRLRALGVRGAVVVAHSKGGLIGKLLMTAYADEGLVTRMLAVSTPFEGARYSRYAPTRPLRSFHAGHPVMGSLAKNLEANARIVSVGAVVDPLIGRTTRLDGGRNIVLPVVGHFRILADPGLLGIVDDFLADAGDSGEQAG
ncbi:alpha/beta hydrolase [Sinomonas sp. ASV322]|uniref:esterase/lipase family protein n=1 Tax=Sinomonas sp. ASV322 TaxID=3041920 RepID=UPI0027DD2FCB|nr:alpha/beta hydrolase [Sinomonas sp. ASV322]MDQ4501728.1 alpha/beta hydrolase [Sinomonas sp. ASV322]